MHQVIWVRVSVSKEARELGIVAVSALFSVPAIANRNAGLEQKKKEVIELLRKRDTGSDPILAGYRELHRICNVLEPPPAEALIGAINRSGRLPNVNTVVDSYNLVSAETLLAIGAHDADKIKGDLIIARTTGTELYVPLGSQHPTPVQKGEYACMDQEKIICRLDIKQCEQTKITKATKHVLVYIQGNRNTSEAYLNNALSNIRAYLQEYCNATPLSPSS